MRTPTLLRCCADRLPTVRRETIGRHRRPAVEHAFAGARAVDTRPSSLKGQPALPRRAREAQGPKRGSQRGAMAPWSLKTVAKRLMGEEEQRVVPVNERRTERRKRTSQTNLLATMGQEAPADLLRKLRGQKLSQKALDEKLLEVIIKLDALGASVRRRASPQGGEAPDPSSSSRGTLAPEPP